MSTVRPPLGQVIATREFELLSDTLPPVTVVLRIGVPVPDPNPPGDAWGCPFRIDTGEQSKDVVCFGVDSIQALRLALDRANTELVSLARNRSSRCLWQGGEDLKLK